MEQTLTVIIPSLNEEDNIRNTVKEVLEALNSDLAGIADYEILLFDDGSTDSTGSIIDMLALTDPKIKAIHNGCNRGFGYNFKKGVKLAQMNYITLIPGDNEVLGNSILKMFHLIGSADIVIPFTMNMEIRSYLRCFLCQLFTFILNSMFRLALHYYNGPVIHRRDLLQQFDVQTHGFAFQAMTLVRMLKSGLSFVEVEMYLRPRRSSQSTALKLKNIISVFAAIARLFWEVKFSKRNVYNKPINRVAILS